MSISISHIHIPYGLHLIKLSGLRHRRGGRDRGRDRHRGHRGDHRGHRPERHGREGRHRGKAGEVVSVDEQISCFMQNVCKMWLKVVSTCFNTSKSIRIRSEKIIDQWLSMEKWPDSYTQTKNGKMNSDQGVCITFLEFQWMV